MSAFGRGWVNLGILALMAQAFDDKNLQVTCDVVPIGEGVYLDPRNVEAEFSVSENGVLVFVSGGPTLGQLVWLDRDGKQIGSRDFRG